MTRRWALASGALVSLSLVACQSDSLNRVGPQGRSSFDRYVSIGTSVSMGTQSDGVIYFTQVTSWPAQLARAAMADFTQPLISATPVNAFGSVGCNAPIIAPLQLGTRFSGLPISFARADSVRARADSVACSPLFSNITLPTNNVAIDGARAYTALYFTPDSAIAQRTGRVRGLLYARVLPPGKTQITAAKAQNPTLVSVELGANELLGVSSGILFPSSNGKDGSYVPLSVFKPIYDKIIDSVKATGAKVLLVAPGIPDLGVFPLFRKGSEIAADSTLKNFRVVATADCSTTNKDNLIALPKLIGTIAAANGSPTPIPFSCADTPGTQDAVLTPDDLLLVSKTQADITTYIKGVATANGFAYAELGSLYNTAKSGSQANFSALALLGSTTPYGPNISLDGVHPSAAGARIIARAAAAALNSTYGFSISVP